MRSDFSLNPLPPPSLVDCSICEGSGGVEYQGHDGSPTRCRDRNSKIKWSLRLRNSLRVGTVANGLSPPLPSPSEL
jgi:hypothetical protein